MRASTRTHEDTARESKARRLIEALRAAREIVGGTLPLSVSARSLTPKARDAVRLLAGIPDDKIPSDRTWLVVIELLEAEEDAANRIRAALDDPFDLHDARMTGFVSAHGVQVVN